MLYDYINAYGIITTALLPIVDGGDVHRCWRQTSATAGGVATGAVFGHQTRPHATDTGVYTICLHIRPNTRALHNFNGQTPTHSPRELFRVPSPYCKKQNGDRCNINTEGIYWRDDNYMDMGKSTLKVTNGETVFRHARSSHV